MSKKNKNYIDEMEAQLDLESSDFSVKVMNYYQFRVSMPDLTDAFYDWYHTSGTVIVNRPERQPANVGLAYTSGDLISLIMKVEKEKNFI